MKYWLERKNRCVCKTAYLFFFLLTITNVCSIITKKRTCVWSWAPMIIQEQMSLEEKLHILSDAAKYDVACTSSGNERKGNGRGMGNCISAGICHSFSADGRCITLLKILFTNECVFDCRYCINRNSNDVPRASFTPEEVCRLTIEFYRRNYIEGLFLSSEIGRAHV